MSGVLRVQIFVWSVKDISASDAVLQDVAWNLWGDFVRVR